MRSNERPANTEQTEVGWGWSERGREKKTWEKRVFQENTGLWGEKKQLWLVHKPHWSKTVKNKVAGKATASGVKDHPSARRLGFKSLCWQLCTQLKCPSVRHWTLTSSGCCYVTNSEMWPSKFGFGFPMAMSAKITFFFSHVKIIDRKINNGNNHLHTKHLVSFRNAPVRYRTHSSSYFKKGLHFNSLQLSYLSNELIMLRGNQ